MRVLILSLCALLFVPLQGEPLATKPSLLEENYGSYHLLRVEWQEGRITLSNGTVWKKLEADYRWDELELKGQLRYWKPGDRIHLRARENGKIRLAMENSRQGSLIGVRLESLPSQTNEKLYQLEEYEFAYLWSDADEVTLSDGSRWTLPGEQYTRREIAREWEEGDLLMTDTVNYWKNGPKEKLVIFNLSRDPSFDYIFIPEPQEELEEEDSSLWPQFLQ